jgi:hypothetical protein
MVKIGILLEIKIMEIRYGRKRSGIKRELKAKIDEWIESITDDNVKEVVRKNTIVTGGAIASMLLGDKINDFDVYFKTKDAALVVAQYYVDLYNARNAHKEGSGALPKLLFIKEETLENIKGVEEDRVCIWAKSAGVVSDESEVPYQAFETRPENELEEFATSLIKEAADEEAKGKYMPTFISQNAISLTSKLQIIVRFYGEPDKIHDNYDFAHAMCYWDHEKEKLELPAEAMEALLSRTLVYRGSLYPIASIFRMKKFIERGWRITAGQQLKIMWQISEINMKDMKVLREQLTGVDMAYMFQLLEALKDTDSEKVNSTYVGAIIDKIFD